MLAEVTWSTLFQLPQLAIVMGCLTAMTAIIGIAWYEAEKFKSNTELKRSLVERGMSASEIERIMEAGDEEKQE